MACKRKIFITGASGKMGKRLTNSLLESGYCVSALVRNREKFTISHPNLRVVEADLEQIELYLPLMRESEFVYHLAVYQNPMDSNISEFKRTNVDCTKLILDALAFDKGNIKRFIYASTTMVFKPTGRVARDESWPKLALGGSEHYVETKLMALKIVEGFKVKIPTVILYPSIIIDEREVADGGSKPPNGWYELIRKVLGGGVPGVLMCMLGDGKRIMNYVFANNLIEAAKAAMEKGKVGEDYILGGENITARKYILEVGRIRKIRFLPIRVPWSLMKIFSLVKIPRLELLSYIARHPMKDACFNCDKAAVDLGLKIVLMESI